jgi:hypothetical protein
VIEYINVEYLKTGKTFTLQMLGDKLALCTCCNPTFILKNPSGRRFTRCNYCEKEYVETN